MRLIFFKLPNPSCRSMTLGSTQPLTEMSTRNLPEGKGRPARKADNLTVTYELSTVHSRRRESHRKQMHVTSPSLLE
jgi:hypothetical protein